VLGADEDSYHDLDPVHVQQQQQQQQQQPPAHLLASYPAPQKRARLLQLSTADEGTLHSASPQDSAPGNDWEQCQLESMFRLASHESWTAVDGHGLAGAQHAAAQSCTPQQAITSQPERNGALGSIPTRSGLPTGGHPEQSLAIHTSLLQRAQQIYNIRPVRKAAVQQLGSADEEWLL